MPDARRSLPVAAQSLVALVRTGVVRPYHPRTLLRLASTLRRWGTGLAGGYTALAVRMPAAVGLEDDRGLLTFDQLHRHSNAIARGLAEMGVAQGDRVAVLCRNHRWFVLAAVATAKLGADVVLLNTASSAVQVGAVLSREAVAVLVVDDDLHHLAADAPDTVTRLRAWTDDTGLASDAVPGTRVADLMARHDDGDLSAPAREGRTVLSTSGTTGTPKAASRGSGTWAAAASLVSRLPLRHRMRVYVAAPMFHAWGWAHLQLSMLLGSTLVLRRRFDPQTFVALIADARVDAVVVVPVMLQRALASTPVGAAPRALPTLRVVASSGSALSPSLATRWMDAYGDHLYNVYGSTECAWATIATPTELRRHPGTAGRPPVGTVVRLLDEGGSWVDSGRGRVFVGNSMLIDGDTGDGRPRVVDGLMATGDVGRLHDGLLSVEGRDDDMVVTGGENVFPQQVEDCLAEHPDVMDVAVAGVDDDDLGQRLCAWVVLRPGVTLDADALTDHVRGRLAGFAVPREVVAVSHLPRNETGKLLRRELAARPGPSEAAGADR